MKAFDITGTVVGRWTVVDRAPNTKQGQAQWNCVCECGTERVLKSIILRRAISRSCGCYKSETTTERSTKHGHATDGVITPTYHTWASMVARCTNSNNRRWKRYGGRGITVCDRWLTFAHFLADMGEKPANLSLDRIDNDGDYEPNNCRWATASQQARNKANNRSFTLNGQTLLLAEWAELLGAEPHVILNRLKYGWTEERALTEPLRRWPLSRSGNSK